MNPYEPTNEVEDIEEFKKLSAADIRDWFNTVKRPLSSAESQIADAKFEQEAWR